MWRTCSACAPFYFVENKMKQLIQLWVITLIIAIVTIAFVTYGFIYDDSVMFLAGDVICFPLFIFCYLDYKEEYDGYVNNARRFK